MFKYLVVYLRQMLSVLFDHRASTVPALSVDLSSLWSRLPMSRRLARQV
jgi:hypothetical protein